MLQDDEAVASLIPVLCRGTEARAAEGIHLGAHSQQTAEMRSEFRAGDRKASQRPRIYLLPNTLHSHSGHWCLKTGFKSCSY